MLKALLALLLLRADASSYGFSVAWNSDSSLVHHARGYAANVVNIPMNDLTTMRNTEVLCPSMDNFSTHTHDGNRALLTTPLHASQLEEVHPRGHAVLTNNTNTTGQNPLSTTDDQPPRLDHDTSHYTNNKTPTPSAWSLPSTRSPTTRGMAITRTSSPTARIGLAPSAVSTV